MTPSIDEDERTELRQRNDEINEHSSNGVIPSQLKLQLISLLRRLLSQTQIASNCSNESPTARLPQFFVPILHRSLALPISTFYLYLWRVAPNLLIETLFVNYLFPVILESLPVYLSRRHLSKALRETRNNIQHRLITNDFKKINLKLTLVTFAFKSLIFSLLTTVEQLWRTRVMLKNRLLIKRMILERILYSEIGSLQRTYCRVYKTSTVQTDLLDQLVFNDINETLQLFNSTLPAIIRGFYSFVFQTRDLFLIRQRIDALALLRPTLLSLSSEAIIWFKDKFIVDKQALQMTINQADMSRVVGDMIDGLPEIQVNNDQESQLKRLDCKLVQLGSHAIAEETRKAEVKDCSKVHKKRMNRRKRGKREPKFAVTADRRQTENSFRVTNRCAPLHPLPQQISFVLKTLMLH